MPSRRLSSWRAFSSASLLILAFSIRSLQLVELARTLFLLPLLLERLHLLGEVVLLGRPAALGSPAFALLRVEPLDLDLEGLGQSNQAGRRLWHLEERLLFVGGKHEVGGHGIGQLARVLHADGREHGVVVEVIRHLHVAVEELDHAPHHGFDVAFGGHARDRPHQRLHEAALFAELQGQAAIHALDQHPQVSVGQAQALHDLTDGPVGANLARVTGNRASGSSSGGEKEPLAALKGVFEGQDGRLPADDEGHHHVREDDHIAQRNRLAPASGVSGLGFCDGGMGARSVLLLVRWRVVGMARLCRLEASSLRHEGLSGACPNPPFRSP